MYDECFRLTIRNVNRKNYTLSVETIASFRLTIRNVNFLFKCLLRRILSF